MFSVSKKTEKSTIFIPLLKKKKKNLFYGSLLSIGESLEVKKQLFTIWLQPIFPAYLSPLILAKPDRSRSLNKQSLHFHATVLKAFSSLLCLESSYLPFKI